ncbi:MAG: hypothetical protein GX130_04125 [Candidatus Hydrogenedens sp.]|jgi:hypothetical protein|nr:hypothetical protein [Candidatus Hydrogenedens sp.]
MKIRKTFIDIRDYAPAQIRWLHEKSPYSWKAVVFSAGLFLVAAFSLLLAAAVDLTYYECNPWHLSAIYLSPTKIPADVKSYPVAVRPLTPMLWTGEDIIHTLFRLGEKDPDDLSTRWELLIAADLKPEELQPLLLSGRLPEPGTNEVLAGDLASEKDFALEGKIFTVVGHLRPALSGFICSYLLPDLSNFADIFPEDNNAVFHGLLLPEKGLDSPDAPKGKLRRPLRKLHVSGEFIDDEEGPQIELPAMLGGIMRTLEEVAWWSFLSMILCAFSGSLFFIFLFRQMHLRQYRLFAPIHRAMNDYQKFFVFTHFFMYAAFFFAMHTTLHYPAIAFHLKRYIMDTFSQGGLEFIGSAYDAGNVFQAAWATFYNNYIDQTLFMTFGWSLLIPVGVMKTLGSFILVGGVMAPMWVGTPLVLIFHSLTMIVELEAYIIASFAVLLWPYILIRGIRNKAFGSAVKKGVAILFNAALLTAVILMAAAFYEALTLIKLFGG